MRAIVRHRRGNCLSNSAALGPLGARRHRMWRRAPQGLQGHEEDYSAAAAERRQRSEAREEALMEPSGVPITLSV